MKYFIAPVLAFLLVGYPTVSSVVQDDTGLPSASQANLTQKKDEAAKHVKSVQEALQALTPVADISAKPYGPGPLPDLSESSPLRPAWQGYTSLSADAGTFLQAVRDFPDPSSAKAAATAQIDGQIAKITGMAGGLKHEAVKQMAEDYLDQLGTVKQEAARLEKNRKLLQDAQTAYDAGKYGEACDKLKLWEGELTPEARALLERGQFHVEGSRLEQRVRDLWNGGTPTPEWENLMRELQAFNDRGSLLSATASENQIRDKLGKALANMTPRFELYRVGSLRPLRPWLAKAKPIVLSSSDLQLRSYAQTLIRGALERELPTKRSPDESYQEGITMGDKGELLVGTWQVMGNGTYFHFWPRGANRTDAPQIWLRKNLKQTPTTPLTVRCANDYQQARDKLFGQLSQRTAWEDFVATCQRLADELNQRGGGPVTLSLTNEIAFAKEILAAWEDIEPFLSQ